ncbi:MAG: hypothetical protein GY859_40415, partial [Desulfobacterales bacterium]|nr:hypothetical protein [Desulfobacterales bacterium]
EIPGEIPGEGPDPGTTAPGDPAAEKQFSPRPDLENEYVAPRGEMEKTVAGIWENLLQIKPLGATDDLLTLGADSLLGMRFCSRVFETFGIEIQGARVFEAHRVADLAAIIEEARDAGNSERDVAGEILQKLDFIKDLSDSETDRLLTELADGGA